MEILEKFQCDDGPAKKQERKNDRQTDKLFFVL